jgi:hypothetical protein
MRGRQQVYLTFECAPNRWPAAVPGYSRWPLTAQLISAGSS